MTNTEAVRGPGRPRKSVADEPSANEAEAIRTATEIAKNMIRVESEFVEPGKPTFSGDTIGGEPLMEVLLLKTYAPVHIENDMGEMVPQGEIKQKIAAGSTVRLPKTEAARALKLGIAQVTENTFK